VITYYDKNDTKQPRVLVQTAGHVAGAAFYYQRSSLTHDPWEKDKVYMFVYVFVLKKRPYMRHTRL